MTTARSSFSLARLLPVYRNILRRHRGTALFYGALGFLFLPAQYLLTIVQNQENTDDWVRWALAGPSQAYNGVAVFFFTALMLVVPLITAANLFSYLHNRRAVDVYHSLPLTRAELFGANVLAGMTMIWGPLAVNFLLTALCSFLLPGVSTLMIVGELLCWMVVTLAIFAITAFCAVELGTDFDTAIFSLGLNGVVAGVYLFFLMLAEVFVYGFSVSETSMRFAYRLSPVSLIIGRQVIAPDVFSVESAQYLAENNGSMLAWLAVSLVVLALGVWRYTRRKSEMAESVGEMGPLQIFMRSAGTLLGGAGLGLIFCGVFGISPEHERGMSLVAIAIGSLIVYFIGDVILTRSVRSVPRALPVALITTAGVCVLVGGMMYDLIGFGRWTPDASQVETLRLSRYQSRFYDQPALGRDRSSVAFQDPEAVALVIAAQRQQIDLHREDTETSHYIGNDLRLSYEMKDGRTVTRRYLRLDPAVLEQLVVLEVDDELLAQSHPAFVATSEWVEQVTVTNTLGNTVLPLKLTNEQTDQLLVALREDLLSQPVEELKNGAMAVCSLTLDFRYVDEWNENGGYQSVPAAQEFSEGSYPDRSYNYARSVTMLTASYRNTLALLKQFGTGGAMENDWSQVKTAYALPYNRSYGRTMTVAQTGLDRVVQTESDLQDFLTNYEGGSSGLTRQSFAFSPMELTAIRSSLTSVAPTYGDPFVVVGVAAGEDSEAITGYYLAPLSALPARLKKPVAQMVGNYYGDYALEEWGYSEAIADETGVISSTTDTAVIGVTAITNGG